MSWGLALLSLATDVSDALDDRSVPVARVDVQPGAVSAWDEVSRARTDGRRGQLTVRAVGTFYTVGDLSPVAVPEACARAERAVTVEVLLTRPVPVVTDAGAAPDPAKVTGAAVGLLDDLDVLLDAVTGWAGRTLDSGGWIVRQSLPVGAEGGMAGWSVTLDVLLDTYTTNG